MALPTGLDVATVLGRTQDGGFIKQADQAVRIQYQFAKAYCRGRGFEDDEDVPPDLWAVIVTSSARLTTNPVMLRAEQAESYTSNSGPDGDWSRSELSVLNKYRRRHG